MTSDVPSDRPEVWAIGPVPPPVTGMTLFTECVVRRLKEVGPITHCNWSHGRAKVTRIAHGVRIFKTIGCAVKLLRVGRIRDGRLYLTANSRSGLALTWFLVNVARRLGYRVFLHHHTYGYINRFNRWMSRIDRRMGTDGVHVVHSDQMIGDFQRQYESRCRFVTLFPSAVSIDVSQPRVEPATPFRLGMLSNLTIEKGVDLAIETFIKLAESGSKVGLELAGPIFSREAETLIAETLKNHHDSVRHTGPVYSGAKVEFLHRIDVLLFPTRYKDESWGIVLHEAFAAGAPVITFDRGFTKTIVGTEAGLTIDPAADFAQAAATQIRRWIERPEEFRRASQAAIDQAEYLSREGSRMLNEFADIMFKEATH